MNYLVTRCLEEFVQVEADSEHEAIENAKETMDSLWHIETISYQAECEGSDKL